MRNWLFAIILGLNAHFSASYLVPLDKPSQSAFWGLLPWFWPWIDGDHGPLGIVTSSSGFPVIGFFVAVISAGLLILSAMAGLNIWIPQSWWKPLAVIGAGMSLFLMIMFPSFRKIIPIAVSMIILGAALFDKPNISFR